MSRVKKMDESSYEVLVGFDKYDVTVTDEELKSVKKGLVSYMRGELEYNKVRHVLKQYIKINN